ncbi:hypothetical protein [Aeromonas dhakensis]|uniref:hypothetical protein n=1 Tax=Aeromonas dhakensis TaxID=196024 RepID=UPI001C5A7461|nr:hypothetical protein [Aeromonas dhakensis]MBW3692908.1 hypothetical protein [Aeromonas dhakensis]
MSYFYGQNTWDPMSESESLCFERYLCEIVSQHYEMKLSYLNKKFGYSPTADIALPIKKFIKIKSSQMKAFSIIRMNDGEGSVLFNSKNSSLNEYIIKRISKIIYGDPNTIFNDKDEYYNLLIDAIVDADIIGAPESSFIERRLVNEKKENVDVRAVCGTINQIDILYDLAINGRISEEHKITSVWLSKYLLAHYAEIFSYFDDIVVITGNEGLANKIQRNLFSGNIREILIPTQRAKITEANVEPHWPNRYVEVLSELEGLPSYSLVVVAAGILGKVYCNHAKKHGHGAIDIGHVADIWTGKISRPGVEEEFIKKWSLA